ncbi:MAG: VOC family protein [Methanosarcinales archaeon]|nr:VOC family protein [Methanosarcinales archaeon]
MNRVVHFEIHADQPERAAQFYSRVFGWKIQKWEGPVDYWLASTGEGQGIDGAIKWRAEPHLSTVNTIQVPSVEEFISRIEECGGKALTPRMTIPGIGYHSFCQDTEGTVFGIMEEDSTAR